MKAYYIPTIVVFASMFLWGCADDREDGQLPATQTSPIDDPSAVIAQIEVSGSRTSLDISRNTVWSSGDEIRIFGATATSGEVYVTSSNNTRTGIFLPFDPTKTVEDATRYAVYPASAGAASTLSGTTLDVDLAGLATQPYVAALGAGIDVAAVPMIATAAGNSFTFTNICGGIRLLLNDYQGLGLKIKSVKLTAKGNEQIAGKVSVDLSTGVAAVSKTGTLNSVTVDCGEGSNISSSGNLSNPTGFIVFLPAAEYSGFGFVVTDTQGRCFEIETQQPVTVTAGVVTPLEALPLTLYYGSANCYLSSGSGLLEIDATPYYTFGSDYVHEGLACLDAGGVTAGAATKTKIVWQQVETTGSGDVVSSATLDGTTLKVTKTGTAGNAVVAICDAADEILWSYHVWVTTVSDVKYENTAKGMFYMMDRNLGATSTTIKDRNTYGLFYQWGRKDPFARNLTAPYPTSANTYASDPSPLQKSAQATPQTGTIAYANRNPDVRLLSATDWYSGAGGNDLLWGHVDSESGVKTVYDPCPAGYRMADYACFAELPDTDKGNCNAQYGHMMVTDGGTTTSYYPTAGYLPQNNDIMQYMEYRGYLWNNQPSTGPNGTDVAIPNRLMYNNAGLTKLRSEYRSAGMSVRCLKM